MTEIVVTSSALILALLALRRLFRQKISRRVQYALWALVLVRLLVPVSLPAAEFSVLSAAGPVLSELDGTALYLEPMQERAGAVEGDSGRRVTASPYRYAAMGLPSEDNTRAYTDDNWVTHEIAYARQIDLAGLLRPVWYAGMAVMACWLAVTNLRFWRKLRRTRIPLELEGRRVYLVEEGLISPCLFGLLRPAIYLTPAALETEERTRHVIAHESTHARHLDPLWALLRGVCLTVYWFNPLVWWAAAASRADCELACDEGALRRLGEDARLAYGQTLLGLIPVQRAGGSPLSRMTSAPPPAIVSPSTTADPIPSPSHTAWRTSARYMSDSKPRRSATSTSTPIRNFRWWRYRPISRQLKPRWSPENSTARKYATPKSSPISNPSTAPRSTV